MAELLWFEALGYGERYWDVFIVQALAATGSAVFSAAAIFCFTWGFLPGKRWVRYGAIVLASLAGFHWGYSHWETILKFIHAAPTEQVDPIFGKAVGFYLFQLPMIDAMLTFLFLLAGLALVACALDAFFLLRFDGSLELDAQMNPARTGAVYRAAGILLIFMAAEKYVERFHLLYSQLGAVNGPGWTDVNIRLPALTAMSGVMLLVGILLMLPPLRRRLHAGLTGLVSGGWQIHAATFGATAVFVFVVQVILLSVLPSLFQSLRVEPNEITFEAPYIAHNIQWTRQGFRLDTVEERVHTLAPFLEFDDDPYIVLEGGRLYWIIDAYTTSGAYPYSEPFYGSQTIAGSSTGYRPQTLAHFAGRNYVRNAVKAVVDAYDGSVDFYVFDDKDPLILTWRNVFPELFKDRESMPAGLVKHVRYPVDMLLLQGLMYAKYHMTDPTVFYNQEDLWVRATEKYYDRVQPVEPYYIMWELPESDHPEFVLMTPFTPKNRQVSIGWIAGMCDGDNYGRFLAYQFPKEKRVLGLQQVETKIDQDRFLSGQLTLRDQRGSRVIRGNVLAIPVDDTLLYVEPIYLQAETAAYPELRLVALMHNDALSYAESFNKALAGLLGDIKPESSLRQQAVSPSSPAASVRDARDAFNGYLEALGDKRFDDAAAAIKRLEAAIGQLSGMFAEAQDDGEPMPGRPEASPAP